MLHQNDKWKDSGLRESVILHKKKEERFPDNSEEQSWETAQLRKQLETKEPRLEQEDRGLQESGI